MGVAKVKHLKMLSYQKNFWTNKCFYRSGIGKQNRNTKKTRRETEINKGKHFNLKSVLVLFQNCFALL